MLKVAITDTAYSDDGFLPRENLTPLADTYGEFTTWLPLILKSLKAGVPQKLLLKGDFIGVDEPDWDLVEEVQMDIRLNVIPEGVWVMLRGEYPDLYVHFLKV